MVPLLLLLLLPPAAPLRPPGPEQLLVLTVATEATDGYERFLRSARRFNYSVQTLGLGQAWRGGDVAHTVGGGQKVRWLRSAVAPLRGDPQLVLLFVDSYDVVFAGGPRELLAKFRGSGAGVLFAAEGFCWPQEGLAPAYPPAPGGKRYLNSGGFVGVAPAVWRLVERWRFRDDDDDQLFYTRLYLDPALREELGLALDHHSHIFQNLNGAIDEVVLSFEPGRVRVRNVASDSRAVVVHGNGPTKLQLNYLGNYVPGGWSPEGGCGDCDLDLRPLEGVPDEELPLVLVGVFVEQPTPFLPLFLRRLLRWHYPSPRLRLFLHNSEPQHEPHIAALWPRLRRRFGSVRLVGPEEALGAAAAREMGMALCRRDPQCQHYLSLDADVALTHRGALRALLRQNRRVLAPLLSRPGQLWSNFWGALGPDGFYARAHDYVEIVQGKRRGVWNVPYISHAYLVGGGALRGPLGEGPVFTRPHTDPDMAFCQLAREKGLFLHVTNRQRLGHLLRPGGYNASRLHPDLLQLPHNPADWEEQYLHRNYSRVLEEQLYEEPCPHVFRFPLFAPRLGRELLQEARGYGRWGRHHEGAQAVSLAPLGLEGAWLGALRRFLPPIARRLLPGHPHTGPAVLSEVVRYNPGPSPTPPDPPGPAPPEAAVTVSLALSPPQGGGWHFPRQGCAVAAPPPGWALLHPGPLTHPRHSLGPPARPRYALVTLLAPGHQ